VPNILTCSDRRSGGCRVFHTPTNSRARKAGLNELMNLAKEGRSSSPWRRREPLHISKPMRYRPASRRAYAEGYRLFKSNKRAAQRMMQKYLRVKTKIFWTTLQSVPRVFGISNLCHAARRSKTSSPTSPHTTHGEECEAGRFYDMRFVGSREAGFFPRKRRQVRISGGVNTRGSSLRLSDNVIKCQPERK
jgi:hypothetical protein